MDVFLLCGSEDVSEQSKQERDRIGYALRRKHGCTDGGCRIGINPHGGMATNGGCKCTYDLATTPSALDLRRKLDAIFRDIQTLLRGGDIE